VELVKHLPTQSASGDRLRQLRAVLARELHPDHIKTEGIERLIRAEMFKTLWPCIEEIERRTKSWRCQPDTLTLYQ
jgi:hypothetical protein